jgi:hypothetical protein
VSRQRKRPLEDLLVGGLALDSVDGRAQWLTYIAQHTDGACEADMTICGEGFRDRK